MKKVIATIVALCLALSMCVGASAEGTATIGVDKVYAKAGAQAIVPVYIRNADALAEYGDNLAGIEILFSFDDTQLSLLGIDDDSVLTYTYTNTLGKEKTEKFSAKCELSPQGSTNSFRLMLDADAANCKNVKLTGDMKLGDVVFNVKEGVADDTVIKLTYDVIAASDSTEPSAKKFGDKISEVEIEAITVGEPPVDPDSSSEDPSSSEVPDSSSSDESTSDTTSTTSGTTSTTSKTSSKTSTTNPKTGDTGVLAVGALMVLAAGAAFVTMKKR